MFCFLNVIAYTKNDSIVMMRNSHYLGPLPQVSFHMFQDIPSTDVAWGADHSSITIAYTASQCYCAKKILINI